MHTPVEWTPKGFSNASWAANFLRDLFCWGLTPTRGCSPWKPAPDTDPGCGVTMRPLLALIRLRVHLKNGGICVALQSPGWHNTGAPRVPHGGRGAGGGGQAGPLCPSASREGQDALNGRPHGLAPWVSQASGYLGRWPPTRAGSLFFARLIRFCLCSPLPCRL